MAPAMAPTASARRRSGDGFGCGYGFGCGSGSGSARYGSGADIARCRPHVVLVTADRLAAADACGGEVRRFRRAFPAGATWPDDIPAAAAEGLDVSWAAQHLGLLEPRDTGGLND